jgi:uncharacterized protein (TIGR02246 family)
VRGGAQCLKDPALVAAAKEGIMKVRLLLALVVVAVIGLAPLLLGGQNPSGTVERAQPDEEGIRQAMRQYTAAFNKGDIDAVMAFWTADAEFISDDGKAVRGRDAIGAQTKRVFSKHKQLSIKLVSKSIRFVKPDVALQDGVVTLSAQDKSAESGPYTAVWIKTDGRWLMNSVRDLPAEGAPPAASNYGAVKQLEWLVGEWVSEEGDTRVTLSFHWEHDRNFLRMEQAVTAKGQTVLTVTQMIGWDALQQQLRSWVFDSHGGFGESYWTRRGNQWDVNAAGVLSDGRATSSVNVWKYIDDKTLEWQSVDRQLDSQPMPDVKATYHRKPAKE